MNSTRAPIIALIIWLAAVPWLLFPDFFPVVTAFFTASLLVIPLLLRRALSLSKGRANGRFLPATPFDSFILLYLALTAVAFLVTPLPAVSLPKLLVILAGAFGYYVIQPWLGTPRRLTWLIPLLAVAGSVVAVASLFALKWPERQVLNLQALTAHLPHLSGDFYIHHNELAGTLLPLLPFALALWRWPAAGRWTTVRRPLSLLTTAVILAGLLLTQSRSALFGLILFALAWAFWARFRIRALVAAMAIVIGLFLLPFALPDLAFSDLSRWIGMLDVSSKTGSSNAASWDTRLEIWRAGGNILVDYPVLGAGLYTFEPLSRANYIYELVGPDFEMAHAHNLLLQSGASYGWPGVLAVASLWGVVLYGLWHAGYAERSQVRRLAALFGAACIAYLSFNLLDTLTLGQKPGLIIWLILAGCAALVRLDQSSRPPWAPAQQFIRFLPLAPVALLAVLALTPALPRNLAYLQLDRLRLDGPGAPVPNGDRLAGDARRLGLLAYAQGNGTAALSHWQSDPDAAVFLQSQGRLATEADELASAISWHTLSLALDPANAAAYFYRGYTYELDGNYPLSFRDYQRAYRQARQNNLDEVWLARTAFSYGRLLLHYGETTAALDAFQQAIHLQPQTSWYYQGLGDALAAVGDQAGASAAYQKAKERRP